jgi:hypothetical protein
MRPTIPAVLSAIVLFVASWSAICQGDLPLAARPAGPRFLGSDPIGPLAVVNRGAVRTPRDGACRVWGPVGSRWSELDRLGKVVGTVTVSGRSFYDYSGCDELSVRRQSGRAGAGVYVDARDHYVAPPATKWSPDGAPRASLERLAAAHQASIKDLDPSHPVAFADRAFFFEWGSAHQRFAVVGGRSLLVVSWRSGAWTIAHEERPAKMRAVGRGFIALAITDMNGDGRPELVVHELEESGEWYGDATFSMGASGRWTRIGPGIFGSTA